MRQLDLLTDVEGITVGHAEDEARKTGVTAICGEKPLLAAVHCCGGAPATRETDILHQDGLVEKIDAIMLCGGSAFGLNAADGAMDALGKKNKGFLTSAGHVPIVPAAAIFDLYAKKTPEHVDYRTLGRRAVENATKNFQLGNFGAGIGARAGPFKGGVGSASTKKSKLTVSALAVVNSFGSPAFENLSAFRAWEFEEAGEFGGLTPNKINAKKIKKNTEKKQKLVPEQNKMREHTTLCVLAFNCALPKSALRRIAAAAQSALAIAIYPSLTLFDGDIIFAISSAKTKLSLTPERLELCERLACKTLARAIAKGVWYAEGTKGIKCFRDARNDAQDDNIHGARAHKQTSTDNEKSSRP